MGVEIPQGDMNTNLITDTITSILAHLKAHNTILPDLLQPFTNGNTRHRLHCAGKIPVNKDLHSSGLSAHIRLSFERLLQSQRAHILTLTACPSKK